MRDTKEPVDIIEQINQIADEICGYREADFFQIMTDIQQLKISDLILRKSQNAVSRRRDICNAVDNLMAELEGLSDDF